MCRGPWRPVRPSRSSQCTALTPVLSGDPAKRARAIVQAVTHYNNPQVLADVSSNLGDAMVGISVANEIKTGKEQALSHRGN